MLKSGIFGAESLVRVMRRGGSVSAPYLEKLESIRGVIGRLHSVQIELETAAKTDPPVLAPALEVAHRETLTIHSR